MPKERRILGLISDTHGLLRKEALHALRGSDLILHAGDVGGPEILEELRTIAPVIAVRGNVDTEAWAKDLPLSVTIEAGFATIHMLHILGDLYFSLPASRIQILISGHSHKPGQTGQGGVVCINPGSAGPRRFQFPVTVARLDLAIQPWKAEFIQLDNKE